MIGKILVHTVIVVQKTAGGGAHFRMETKFPGIKLTQNCYINMNIFFLEN